MQPTAADKEGLAHLMDACKVEGSAAARLLKFTSGEQIQLAKYIEEKSGTWRPAPGRGGGGQGTSALITRMEASLNFPRFLPQGSPRPPPFAPAPPKAGDVLAFLQDTLGKHPQRAWDKADEDNTPMVCPAPNTPIEFWAES